MRISDLSSDVCSSVCFSRGISKVETAEQLKVAAEQLFQHTALLLAQEYMYTEFDWRIGVLAGQPLYACQYFMSRGHWQIYNHAAAKGGDRVDRKSVLQGKSVADLVVPRGRRIIKKKTNNKSK